MELSIEEIQNLSNLFLSKDDTNTQIAFEIIQSHKLPVDLVTEVFAVFKFAHSLDLRTQASDLLQK